MAARRFIVIALAMLTPFLLALGCETEPIEAPISTSASGISTEIPRIDPTPTRFPTHTPAPQPTADNSNCAPIGSTGGLRPAQSDDGEEKSVTWIPLDEAACYGGILKVAYTEEGPSFNTWEETGGVAFKAMHPLHNMLIRPQTWGNENDFNNLYFSSLRVDLVVFWEWSADGVTWIFHLHDGITWSDGVPITCRDVKWSFDMLRTGANMDRGITAPHLDSIQQITCESDLDIIFHTEVPDPGLIEAIGLPHHIIRPAHVYEGTDLSLLREEIPSVVSGPFHIAQWVPHEVYVFEGRADYWDAPFPYLDGIEMIRMSRASMIAALSTGTIDVGDPHGYTGTEGDSLLNECDPEVCQVWPRVTAASLNPVLFLNQQRQPWNDTNIIGAVALAIDNKQYLAEVTGSWSALPTGCGFYLPTYWALPAERCAQVLGYGDVIGATTPAEDKDRAREILREAGYWNSETDSTDLVLSLSFVEGNQRGADAIAGDLAEIGIEVEFLPLATEAALEHWSSGDFDAGMRESLIAGVDPQFVLTEFFHEQAPRNYSGFFSEEFGRLFFEEERTLDLEVRKQVAWLALELALRESGTIFIAHDSYVPVFGARVRGLMPAIDYLAEYGPQNRYDHVWLAW